MAEGSRIIIDQGKKLIKVIWDGKMDFTEIKDLCEKVTDELKKFKKGEPLVLGDTRALTCAFCLPARISRFRRAICSVYPIARNRQPWFPV